MSLFRQEVTKHRHVFVCTSVFLPSIIKEIKSDPFTEFTA